MATVPLPNLKYARQKRDNMGRYELAKRASCSVTTIMRLEDGGEASEKIVGDICQALGATYEQMCRGHLPERQKTPRTSRTPVKSCEDGVSLEKLYFWRKAVKISKDELAARTGTTPHYISQAENGKKIPSDIAEKIAAIFGTTPDDIDSRFPPV